MFKRIMVGLALTLGLALGGLSAIEAHADTGMVTITAHVSAAAAASASAEAHSTASSSAYAAAAGQVLLKDKVTKSCYWTKGWNSVGSKKHLHWFWEPKLSKVCKLKKSFKTKGPHGNTVTVKYEKVGGGTSGKKCKNPFLPSKKAPTTATEAAILDLKVGTSATVATMADAKANASAKVNVELSYTYNGVTKTVIKVVDESNVSGSGHAKDSATVTATADAEASIKKSGDAIASAKARAEAKAQANAKSDATANAVAEAKVDVDLTIEIPIETTPPTPAPLILEAGPVNDVMVNNERPITVTGTVASGHTATLFASAKNGGTISANKTQTVSGKFSVTITYKASTEVGTDWIALTLTQDDGQVNTLSTNVFNIIPRPVTPQTVKPTVEQTAVQPTTVDPNVKTNE